jgi:hypothetical protein
MTVPALKFPPGPNALLDRIKLMGRGNFAASIAYPRKRSIPSRAIRPSSERGLVPWSVES